MDGARLVGTEKGMSTHMAQPSNKLFERRLHPARCLHRPQHRETGRVAELPVGVAEGLVRAGRRGLACIALGMYGRCLS